MDALGLPPIPVDLSEPLTINFRGPERAAPLPTVRAAHALRVMGQTAVLASLGVDAPPEVPGELADVLRDRTVVVCRVDRAAGDRFVTPYSFPMLHQADMAGGRIQAQLIDTLLSGRHVRTLPRWLPWLLALALALGAVFTRRALRDDVHTALWLLAGLALVAGGVALFRATDGVVLELAPPLCTILITLVALRLHGWAEEG
jgi:CHASE2 domain-containing sensor protein